MSEFVFLYRAEPTTAPPPSPEQMQKTMQKWMGWMKDLEAKGHLKSAGHPLERGGKVVKGKEKVITDGPYTESKDVIGGYTLVEAQDLAQAAELTKGCPIFETGGIVEVRPIMQMNM